MSNRYRSLHTAPASNTKMSERKHYRNDLTTTKNNKKSKGYKGMNNHMNFPNKKTYYNHHSKQVRRFGPNNIYRDEQTTFIGRGVRNYFLGGGKPIQTPCLIRDSNLPKPLLNHPLQTQ